MGAFVGREVDSIVDHLGAEGFAVQMSWAERLGVNSRGSDFFESDIFAIVKR